MTPSVSCAPLKGISSMATRQILAELCEHYRQQAGVVVDMVSVGGVDAAKRVAAGEAFDVVVLASDAIDRLMAAGHLRAGSRVDLVRSGVAVAVREGQPLPDISTQEALKRTVLAASSISCSTGPSGVALAQLFERWGIAEDIRSRMVQAPPGVPVGSLVASGQVELGFQQLSELLHLPGITLVGPLPDEVQITTVFSAGLPATLAFNAPQVASVRGLLGFMTSAVAAAAIARHGMSPV
jgi:molybdate transport system substrate-binding protein